MAQPSAWSSSQGQRNKFLRHLPQHSINPAGTWRQNVGAVSSAEPFPAELEPCFGITMVLPPLTALAEPWSTKDKWKSCVCSEEGSGSQVPLLVPILRAGHAALGMFPLGAEPLEQQLSPKELPWDSPAPQQSTECGTQRAQSRKLQLHPTAAWKSLGPTREASAVSLAAVQHRTLRLLQLIIDQHSFQRSELPSEMCFKSEKVALTDVKRFLFLNTCGRDQDFLHDINHQT